MSLESGPTNGPMVELETSKEKGLPELPILELAKSSEVIQDAQLIRSWNNYTLVTAGKKIRIFDENARELTNLSKIDTNQVTLSWSNLRNPSGNYPDRIYSDKVTANMGSYTMKVSDIPLGYRGRVKRLVGNTTSPFSTNNRNNENATIDDLVTLADGNIIISAGGMYEAFKTRNPQGIVLAPKDWVRLSASGPFPEDIKIHIEKLVESEMEGGYKQLTDDYAALATDVSLNIVSQKQGKQAIYSELVPNVLNNVITDPKDHTTVYYCRTSSPHEIERLKLEGEPSTWSPIRAPLPTRYDTVENFQLDPNGNFFLFSTGKDSVLLSKETLEEVGRIPGVSHANFDPQGRVRVVDNQGHLVIYEPQFEELEKALEKYRISQLAHGIANIDIFDKSTKKKENLGEDTLEALDPIKKGWEERFTQAISQAKTQEDTLAIREGFKRARQSLEQQNLKANEIAYVLEGVEKLITGKESEFADEAARKALSSIQQTLSAGLSITTLSEARSEIEAIKGYENLLDTSLRQELHEVSQTIDKRALELFRERGQEIIKDIEGLLSRTKDDLDKFTTKPEMDDWLEFRYPQLKSRLGALAHDCPLEADEAYKAIVAARNKLQELADTYEHKFKQEYAKVREKAVERMESTVGTLEQDVAGLIDRLRSKGFADRAAAESYLNSSEAYKVLSGEITGLQSLNPDVAKELDRALKVKISNTLTEIERGGKTQIAETGQQMVMFGKTAFPKWEAKVQERMSRSVEVAFEEDAKSHGPGVKATDILGDVVLNIRTQDGSEKVRLYEDWFDENEWRFGLKDYKGVGVPPSYTSAEDFKGIRKAYVAWDKGIHLRAEYTAKQQKLHEIYGHREKPGARTEKDTAWKDEYQKALGEFAAFCAHNNIPLLRRIDQVKAEPEVEHTNGKGFVPQWQSHWVADPQTERDLEEMAQSFKMQMDLQEGMLNLKGHAGTGKDVRIKMFSALTNRPYFGIDCTKWTTEFELSEDVMLESENGASQTVRVPSAVLNGITTPGALVYFNEFNAMPEQAQIFLHALMDEKRSLTLKTSSGKVVRAHPSVLLASSMNPGYPGTFEPQFATRSRMVSLEIGYPPLTQPASKADQNKNPVYDTSEPLRVAREVDSLTDLTIEANMDRNDFVKTWNHHVNGIENGAPSPTSTQKFDIDVIMALTQFSNKLRDDFIKVFEKSRDARNALPVSQPLTGRELRRAAYALNQITPEEKATANPEVVARQLLDRFFLAQIDSKEDQTKIRTAMNTWTSSKRVRT